MTTDPPFAPYPTLPEHYLQHPPQIRRLKITTVRRMVRSGCIHHNVFLVMFCDI
jgi:hypothetical protein